MHPALSKLAEEMDRREPLNAPSDFEKIVSPLLLELAASGAVSEIVYENLLSIDDETLANPCPLRNNSKLLYSGRCGNLILLALRPNHQPTLNGSPVHQVICALGGEVSFDLYRHSPRIEPYFLDKNAVPRKLRRVILARQDSIFLEAGKDVIDVQEGEALLLAFQSHLIFQSRWVYDRRTKTPMAMAAAQVAVARVDEALEMLRQIGGPEDGKACEAVFASPFHHLRWKAVQTAFSLKAPEAEALLLRALDDPHPQIRLAASRVVERRGGAA